MPVYNLIKYINNDSKTSASFWKYFKDEAALTGAGIVDNFSGNSVSFKFKKTITGKTVAGGTKIDKIMVKYM